MNSNSGLLSANKKIVSDKIRPHSLLYIQSESCCVFRLLTFLFAIGLNKHKPKYKLDNKAASPSSPLYSERAGHGKVTVSVREGAEKASLFSHAHSCIQISLQLPASHKKKIGGR